VSDDRKNDTAKKSTLHDEFAANNRFPFIQSRGITSLLKPSPARHRSRFSGDG